MRKHTCVRCGRAAAAEMVETDEGWTCAGIPACRRRQARAGAIPKDDSCPQPDAPVVEAAWLTPLPAPQPKSSTDPVERRRGRPSSNRYDRGDEDEWRARIESAAERRKKTQAEAREAELALRDEIREALRVGFVGRTLAEWTGLSLPRIGQIGAGR